MSTYLVDTDWLIEMLNGSTVISQELQEHTRAGLAISLITYGELYQGAWYSRDSAHVLPRLRNTLSIFDVLPLNAAAMERFAIVRGALTRNQRQQIGDMDLLIAATALEHDLILMTNNVRDFRLVPGLRLYQPNPA